MIRRIQHNSNKHIIHVRKEILQNNFYYVWYRKKSCNFLNKKTIFV